MRRSRDENKSAVEKNGGSYCEDQRKFDFAALYLSILWMKKRQCWKSGTAMGKLCLLPASLITLIARPILEQGSNKGKGKGKYACSPKLSGLIARPRRNTST